MSSVVLLLLATAGCGHVPSGASHGDHDGTVVQGSAEDSITLAQGYGPITSLAGDPTGSGAWFWDDTKSELSIFHVNSQGTLTSWPVLSSAENSFQAIAGFTVTPDGVAWLGINSTLTRLDTRSGAVQTWQIPAPADNPAAESYVPSGQKGQHLVQGIAVAPGGSQVAIAMSHSSSVELFDPSARTFTQIAMPFTSDEPVAVAYSPDGTLGIVVADYVTHREDAALLVKPGGAGDPTIVTVADSSAITSNGASGFIVGSSRPSLVGTDGTTTPIAVPGSSLRLAQTGATITVMPNGDLAVITSAGVLEFPADASSSASASAASVTLQLPAEQCQPNAGSYELATPQPSATGQCHPEADAMTVDAAGGVWVVPGTGGAKLERLIA